MYRFFTGLKVLVEHAALVRFYKSEEAYLKDETSPSFTVPLGEGVNDLAFLKGWLFDGEVFDLVGLDGDIRILNAQGRRIEVTKRFADTAAVREFRPSQEDVEILRHRQRMGKIVDKAEKRLIDIEKRFDVIDRDDSSDPKPDSKPDSNPDPKSDLKLDPKLDPKPDSKPDDKPDDKPKGGGSDG